LDAADHAAAALRGQAHGQASEARIAMLRAQLSRLDNKPERERAYLASVLTTAPEYASLIGAELLECYRRVGQQAEGLEVLRAHYLRHPSLDMFNVVFRELRAQQGYTPAWTFAREALRAHPSLLGLDRLLEAELAAYEDQNPIAGGAAEGANRLAQTNTAAADVAPGADLSLLRSLIHKHTQRLDRYACRVCGFEARHFYWQCPGCNSWETYEPRRLEEMK
ncbi:MAG: lipopolysaccharide assembly protein LapB, partial [Burkholderiaceae bacterium]